MVKRGAIPGFTTEPSPKNRRRESVPKPADVEVRCRALIVINDFEAILPGNIEILKNQLVHASAVVCVTTQERDENGTWGLRKGLNDYADPLGMYWM